MDKLKGKLRENRMTYDRLAEKLGICKTSLYLRINGHRPFTQWEIRDIRNILGLNPMEVIEMFF